MKLLRILDCALFWALRSFRPWLLGNLESCYTFAKADELGQISSPSELNVTEPIPPATSVNRLASDGLKIDANPYIGENKKSRSCISPAGIRPSDGASVGFGNSRRRSSIDSHSTNSLSPQPKGTLGPPVEGPGVFEGSESTPKGGASSGASSGTTGGLGGSENTSKEENPYKGVSQKEIFAKLPAGRNLFGTRGDFSGTEGASQKDFFAKLPAGGNLFRTRGAFSGTEGASEKDFFAKLPAVGNLFGIRGDFSGTEGTSKEGKPFGKPCNRSNGRFDAVGGASSYGESQGLGRTSINRPSVRYGNTLSPGGFFAAKPVSGANYPTIPSSAARRDASASAYYPSYMAKAHQDEDEKSSEEEEAQPLTMLEELGRNYRCRK